MATIAENLQTLVEQKAAIKTALTVKGKEPTDALKTYAGLIEELENADQITYVLTNADGTQRAYVINAGETPIKLTATENDIRLGSTAVTNTGYTEGQKEIPAYFSSYGKKIILANKEVTLTIHECDYKSLMLSIASYDSANDSTLVNYVSVNDAIYEAKTTTKISDIEKDLVNERINLGITVTEKSVLRYFVVREEV